ncbi:MULTISPECIES: tungstate ABC transporter substrate-binding protein WtpA [unclassified Methanoculleus]|uniref:tungstate ABC transporter substrate-binding protein WtpA n=1 Tax=unclassified Methanoculleus TaxID=2619537 RepID=UPI0025F8EBEC|nr:MULTISPECIES: tungstate ABC transporter substrate-binding protein WtpA [unclassified Methanoculleus]MCK9318683.1 tungstate ABC transporter substrate-binding protein WtpA [Methanoculleus sp.]MDD2254450.1 tungstate ABC transporter substrate-binding protein WtpA [Methanoculleus sp.]MDD2787399.1 tungstate ABC transporter substrate-binding protein WtpA [Methanoculleus sp.]MDD3216703.1 tungstate ABC transporter substrate-binding protein WtpA [Methanoculleus sp.]HOI58791.1 tungstate ABC transporte
MTRPAVTLALLILAVFAASAGCTDSGQERTVLTVVPAGSLLYPLEEVEAAFEDRHPDIDVRLEGHGSIQAIRQVTDLGRAIDVVAVADASLIPDMMYIPMGEGKENYTDWYVPFAANEIVIAYTDRSAGADEITAENWYRVLARPDVRAGFSNPMLDACGYRALMVTALAEEHYNEPGLFSAIIGGSFDPALAPTRADGVTTITLPERMRPADEKVAIRDGSIYLLSLLDAGGIDYAFEYRSVAEEHGLRWIDLPPEINLGSAAHAKDYRKVHVTLGFQRFRSIGSERVGQPIVYAVTVPESAPHPKEAQMFVEFALDAFREGGASWPRPLGTGSGAATAYHATD